MVIAAHRAGPLLHGFEQRALCLGRSTVNLVRQQDVGKDRALHEGPGAVTGGGIFFDDIGAGHITRHQVGSELDALEDQPQGVSEGAHQESFRRSGKTRNQAVAAHEQADHDLFQHLFLADDDAAHLRHDLRLHLAKTRDARLEKFRLQLRRHGS